jgi:S-adenosylmethionine-dependent methyltransferase
MRKTKSSLFHDRIAERYEAEHATGPYAELYHEISWRSMKKYLPREKNAIILDAGGGTGYWSRRFAKRGFRVICADLAPVMLAVGRKLAKKDKVDRRIEFLLTDITDMRCFEDSSFDMVISQGDPVGYCGNPKKAMAELSRVAKKGAHICISIDSFYSVLARLIAAKEYKNIARLLRTHVSDFGDDFPQYNFSVDELRQLFNSSGLEVKEIIGKPVFTRFIPRDTSDKVLSDRRLFKQLLELETRFNAEPSIVGLSGHIQIVGRKIR